MTKHVTQLKHTGSVSVIVFTDMETKELAGKFIANHSDGGVTTAQCWFWQGKFSTDKHYELGFKTVKAGGSGYNKIHSCLTQSFRDHFETYGEVADLDAGLLHKWFNSHGYQVHEIL